MRRIASVFVLTYIVNGLYSLEMKLVQIYQCLCDETRLRILNLLSQRSLCVCQIQQVLNRPQAQVSQHLARMKKDGLVETARHQNWMIYSLPKETSPPLQAHLRCLQDCVQTEPVFRSDIARLTKLKPTCDRIDNAIRARDFSFSTLPGIPAKSSRLASRAKLHPQTQMGCGM
jgi:ArsR family transcriptional regulator, arsenate/arsenite/antimonite-responsive transcriptional repressor